MHGRAIHFEIPVDEAERALDFYRRALGWEPERWGDQLYWTVGDGRDDGTGIRGALTLRSPTASTVTVYIDVADLDATLSRVGAAGGRVVQERSAVTGVGWIARILDSEGNELGLLEPDATASAAPAS